VHFRLTAHDLTYVHGRSEAPETGSEGRWAGRQPSLDEGRSLAEGRIRAWTLSICGLGEKGVAGPPVRLYQGKDLPPRLIRWEGDDGSGRPLPAGVYAYRLDAEDAAGNTAATAWQLLRLAPPPSGDSLKGPEPGR